MARVRSILRAINDFFEASKPTWQFFTGFSTLIVAGVAAFFAWHATDLQTIVTHAQSQPVLLATSIHNDRTFTTRVTVVNRGAPVQSSSVEVVELCALFHGSAPPEPMVGIPVPTSLEDVHHLGNPAETLYLATVDDSPKCEQQNPIPGAGDLVIYKPLIFVKIRYLDELGDGHTVVRTAQGGLDPSRLIKIANRKCEGLGGKFLGPHLTFDARAALLLRGLRACRVSIHALDF